MTDPRKDLAWADAIPDDEDDRPSPYEAVYRDGSMKNECWHCAEEEDTP